MTEPQPADATATPVPDCPRCQGPMWDNRVGKRNPRAPDFKCKDRECDGVVWPPRGVAGAAAGAGVPSAAGATEIIPPAAGMPACPICGGAMWDDRSSKRNPKAPDFKCRNKPRERGGPGCEGVIWPARDGSPSPYGASSARRTTGGDGEVPGVRAPHSEPPPPYDGAPPHDDDDLPF